MVKKRKLGVKRNRKKKIYKKNKYVSWNEAMLRNTDFLIDTYKRFGRRFDLPSEAEEFRRKKGLVPRPKRYEVK